MPWFMGYSDLTGADGWLNSFQKGSPQFTPNGSKKRGSSSPFSASRAVTRLLGIGISLETFNFCDRPARSSLRRRRRRRSSRQAPVVNIPGRREEEEEKKKVVTAIFAPTLCSGPLIYRAQHVPAPVGDPLVQGKKVESNTIYLYKKYGRRREQDTHPGCFSPPGGKSSPSLSLSLFINTIPTLYKT